MSKDTKQICILYYIINLSFLSVVSSLNYSELKLLNPTCSPRDTCSSSIRTYITQLLDWKFRNCFCDEFCQDYGDCCIDSKFYNENEQIEHFRHFECVNIKYHGDVYMKSICMKEWENTDISQLCQNNKLTHGHIPVTSKYTAITYINYYCAICNNDANDLMVWETSLECPSLENIFEQNSNITKNSSIEVFLDNDKLKIYLQREGLQEFHECSSVPSFPKSGNSLLRKCFHAISECVDQWPDVEIAKQCHSYTAVVYSHNETYKNIHCAMCNNIDNGNLHCNPPKSISHAKFAKASNVKAFAILFDFFDFSGSNMVGTHCSENEIWDSIFKKCRKIICKNKNYEYNHGKCVKTKQESEYLTMQLNNHQTLTTINNDIDTSPPNNELILKEVTEAKLDLPQSVTTAIPFIQSLSCNNHCITDTSNNIYNKIPSLKEKDNTNKHVIAKTRNTLHSNHKMINNSISINIEQMTPQSNELIKPEKLNCSQILLTPDEFIIVNNNSIFVRKLQKVYFLDEYRKEGDNVLVCADDFISYKYSYFMCILTVTGLVMSCVCLLLHLFAFFSIPHLRSLAGKNLASLSATLLVSYSIFIVSIFSSSKETLCYIIALLLYYSFLSSFFWMNIISFDIWWTLYETKYFIVKEGKQQLQFLLYSIYSFGIPGIALVIAVTLDKLQPSGFPKEFLPYFGKLWCWFGQRKSLLIFFAFPMIVLMILNVVYFSWSVYIIKSTQQLTVNIRSCSSYINQFRLYASLSVVMGLTWIIGIIAGCIQIEAAWYIFILLNTLQGVFIFVLFTCKKMVWQSFMRLLIR